VIDPDQGITGARDTANMMRPSGLQVPNDDISFGEPGEAANLVDIFVRHTGPADKPTAPAGQADRRRIVPHRVWWPRWWCGAANTQTALLLWMSGYGPSRACADARFVLLSVV
jgi:hypothetical protein